MLSQFPNEIPTGFQKIWKPIETILRTGADVFEKIAPTIWNRTPYPVTPTGTYQPPWVTTKGPQPTIRQAPPLNLGLPLLAIGGVLLFVMMRKKRR